MAAVSRFRAIVDFKGIRVAGFIGWVMWAFIHLTFLTGFKNRFLAGIRLGAQLRRARPRRRARAELGRRRSAAPELGIPNH